MSNTGMQQTVSLMVVTYNSRQDLDRLHDEIVALRTRGVVSEVLIRDNGSTDGSDQVLAGWSIVDHLATGTNVGFGRAMNELAEHASSDVLFLLNPDCSMPPESLEQCLLEFQDPNVGVVAPRLFATGVSAMQAGHALSVRAAFMHASGLARFSDKHSTLRGVVAYSRRRSGLLSVGWLGGAALAIRADTFRAVSGFDPTFFMYGEDVDLGMRVSAAGFQQYVLLSAPAHHQGGGSHEIGDTVRTDWLVQLVQVHNKFERREWKRRGFVAVLAAGYALRSSIHPSRNRRRQFRAMASACRRLLAETGEMAR